MNVDTPKPPDPIPQTKLQEVTPEASKSSVFQKRKNATDTQKTRLARRAAQGLNPNALA